MLFWFSLWTSYNISLGPSCEYNKIFNVHVHFESVCKSWVYLFLEIIFQKWSGLSNSLSPRRESCSQPEFCLFIDYVVFPSRCLSSSSLSLKIHVIIDDWSLFWHGELKNRVDSLQLKPNFKKIILIILTVCEFSGSVEFVDIIEYHWNATDFWFFTLKALSYVRVRQDPGGTAHAHIPGQLFYFMPTQPILIPSDGIIVLNFKDKFKNSCVLWCYFDPRVVLQTDYLRLLQLCQ